MRGPQPPVVTLTDPEHRDLDDLVRRHSAPQQLACRAQVILAAADGHNNAQIACQVGLELIRPGPGGSVGWLS